MLGIIAKSGPLQCSCRRGHPPLPGQPIDGISSQKGLDLFRSWPRSGVSEPSCPAQLGLVTGIDPANHQSYRILGVASSWMLGFYASKSRDRRRSFPIEILGPFVQSMLLPCSEAERLTVASSGHSHPTVRGAGLPRREPTGIDAGTEPPRLSSLGTVLRGFERKHFGTPVNGHRTWHSSGH